MSILNLTKQRRIIVTVAVAAIFSLIQGCDVKGNNTVEYHGQVFHTTKAYSTYGDYKADPNNLLTNELPQIETAIRNATIDKDFDTSRQFIRAAFDLQFPGYGLTQYGEKQQTDGSVLSMFSIEIPKRDEERYLVAHSKTGHFVLIDDFVFNTASNPISNLTLSNNSLIYYDQDGLVVKEHTVLP